MSGFLFYRKVAGQSAIRVDLCGCGRKGERGRGGGGRDIEAAGQPTRTGTAVAASDDNGGLCIDACTDRPSSNILVQLQQRARDTDAPRGRVASSKVLG